MMREQILDYLRTSPEVSVLVIGAGINGIGTFRDLALQGVDVLLVDKGDFGSGASAASSHMLHGGIRYLENGEFRLVREALTERNLMLKNAPHYSKPLPTTIPIFSWFSGFLNAPLKFLRLREKPGERGAFVIKIGLILYDIFARAYRVMPTHQLNLREKSLALYPHLNPEIVCTASYYDAWMPYPERICLELVMDAESMSPEARALNYMSAVAAEGQQAILRDELTGETFIIKPRVVVNAAGPWIDFVNRAMNKPTRFIGGTKGSHIIVDHPQLLAAANGHEIFFENSDGRIVLILPYLGKVMIGTTDIRIDDPEQAVCTEEEVDYMLTLVKKVFPAITVDRSHILFRFCGVRPLPSSDSGFAGNISRDHSVQIVEPNGLKFPIFALIGGKWTTFRAFAEHTTDLVLQRLGKSRTASTINLAIGGGRDYPFEQNAKQAWIKQVGQKTGLTEARVAALFERYGTRAATFAGYITAGEDAPLRAAPEYSRREIAFIAETERLIHLDDLILRRTVLAWLGYANADLLIELADLLAETLGWSLERKREELERTAKLLQERHGIAVSVPV